METNFKRVHTAKDLAISFSVIFAGSGLFFVHQILGVCIVIIGLALLFVCKQGYRKDGDDVILKRATCNISKTCSKSVVEFLEGGCDNPLFKRGNDGGSMRLDVYYNKEKRVAYAQLFDYMNYAYIPMTEVVEISTERADWLISVL